MSTILQGLPLITTCLDDEDGDDDERWPILRDENEINYPFFLRAEHCIGKVADAPDAPPEKSWLCCSSSDIFEERRLGDGEDEGDEGRWER